MVPLGERPADGAARGDDGDDRGIWFRGAGMRLVLPWNV
jgi:hypothetical protein